VDAQYLIPWNSEHAKRVGVAQVGLGGEGKARKVAEVAQLRGVRSHLVELVPVVCDAFVGLRQRGAQARELQAAQCVQRGLFDGIKRQAVNRDERR